MADGINTDVSTTLLSVGDNTISQSSSTYYLYREASASSRYSKVILRGPSITFSNGDKILRACYNWNTKYGKKKGYVDELRVTISSKEFDEFLINEAY